MFEKTIVLAAFEKSLLLPPLLPLRLTSVREPPQRRGKGLGHKQHARAQAKINARRRRRH